MYFKFTVEAEAERTEGKFASRDELSEQIMDELVSADPSSLTGENGGEYEITSWEVEEVGIKK
jgi:hypothetical protein